MAAQSRRERYCNTMGMQIHATLAPGTHRGHVAGQMSKLLHWSATAAPAASCAQLPFGGGSFLPMSNEPPPKFTTMISQIWSPRKKSPPPRRDLGESAGAVTWVELVDMQLFWAQLTPNKNVCILLLTNILIRAIYFLDVLRWPFFIFSPPGFTSSSRLYLKFSKGESFLHFSQRWPPYFSKANNVW